MVVHRSSEPSIVAASAGIERAEAALASGSIVAIPTESSYGLAVDATSERALERLRRVKGRSADQFFVLLVDGPEMLSRYAVVGVGARALIAAHWPGPLTIVLPARDGLPKSLINDRGGVAFRHSSDAIATGLVAAFGQPITATSANVTGSPPAATAQSALITGVELALDGGERRGRASTVVELSGDAMTILRDGPVVIDK